MRLLRRTATGALIMLLLLDALAYYEFWRYGPPIVANGVSAPLPGEIVAQAEQGRTVSSRLGGFRIARRSALGGRLSDLVLAAKTKKLPFSGSCETKPICSVPMF